MADVILRIMMIMEINELVGKVASGRNFSFPFFLVTVTPPFRLQICSFNSVPRTTLIMLRECA